MCHIVTSFVPIFCHHLKFDELLEGVEVHSNGLELINFLNTVTILRSHSN